MLRAHGRGRLEQFESRGRAVNLSSPVAMVTIACPGLQLPVVTVNFQKEWLRAPFVGADDLCGRLDALRSGLRADDLAWIIFTSGTTGKPKGVTIYHRAIYAVTILDHGEVMIAGPGLAAGYLNNPETTAEKFIQWNDERFYRAHDLARRMQDGQFVWAGRADSLVKNRGFLTNLETEVEPAMLSSTPVRQAVAVKWRDRLVGCVQPATVDVEELRGFMTERFDPFIVPDEILAIDRFPLNVNEKTDRRALEARPEDRVAADDDDMRLARNGHRTSAYDALRMAFAVCLHVPFRELGKDSSLQGWGVARWRPFVFQTL